MAYEEFMQHLDNICEHPEKANVAQLEVLLRETLKFFETVRNKVSSEDSDEREEAMREATEIQAKLQQLTEKIYAKTGLTKESAQRILSNPANFNPKDWETVKHIEHEIDTFQKSLSS